MDRRQLLTASTLGLAGLASQGLRAAPQTDGGGGSARSTILIWLNGGPSHVDLWDMKPDAPAEIRGPFQPVATSAPGIRLCQHLPHISRQAHQLAFVRSLGQHGRGPNDHHAGRFYNMTGHATGPSFPNTRKSEPDDWPYIGSVVAAKRPSHPSLPSQLWLPTRSGPDNASLPGAYAGRLGIQHDPIYVFGKHKAPLEFQAPFLTLEGDITVDRLTDRRQLLQAIDNGHRVFDRSVQASNYSSLEQKAFSLLSNSTTKNAFDVSSESQATRARYGHTVNAMSMLMARRLVEAGVPFITIYWYHDYEEDKRRGCLGGAWDTHWKNFSCLKDYLVPLFDRPFAALLEDLSERGLIDETLVVVSSEMGRTPKIGDPRSGGRGAAEPGRDHWTHCQTALLAGGGIQGGQAYGTSDRIGAYPSANPVGPEHIAHTIFHAMGITDLVAHDNQGRPYHLLENGSPLTSLFGGQGPASTQP